MGWVVQGGVDRKIARLVTLSGGSVPHGPWFDVHVGTAEPSSLVPQRRAPFAAFVRTPESSRMRSPPKPSRWVPRELRELRDEHGRVLGASTTSSLASTATPVRRVHLLALTAPVSAVRRQKENRRKLLVKRIQAVTHRRKVNCIH